jgi:outer membrane protein assembly factor BamE
MKGSPESGPIATRMRYDAPIILDWKSRPAMKSLRTIRPLLLALACAALLPLAGCVYRMNIQQGNFLQRKAIEQLQVGMTRSQVRYLLGTPMVPNSFDTDRWDYLYYYKHGRIRRAQEYLLTVTFENDKVARIDNHGKPPIDSQSVPLERAPRPMT